MRALILLGAVSLLSVLVTSTPIAPGKEIISEALYFDRRSAPVTKGGKPGVKGYPALVPNVRKGEYICGNRICKLKPGEIPKGCNGICQYPV